MLLLSLLFVPAVLGSRFSNYYAGENQGACGWWSSDSDFVVAISQQAWDGGSHCGKQVFLSWQGKTAIAKVADKCMECPYDALDFSQGLFEHFGGKGNNLQIGYIYGDWHYIDGSSSGGNNDDGDKKADDDKGKETTKEAAKPTSKTTTKATTTTTTTTSKAVSKTTSHTSATYSSATAQTSSTAVTTPDSPQNLQTFNQAFLDLSGLIAAGPQAAA